MMRLFHDYRIAKDNANFKTRSQYPEVPCYISPIELPQFFNFSSYLDRKCSMQEIKDYLIIQVCILRYNNPEFTKFQINTSFASRIAYWSGNEILLKDRYYITTLLDQVIEEYYSDEDFVKKISMFMTNTKYWYSDEIENILGIEGGVFKKSIAKRSALNLAKAENYAARIKALADDYSASNFDVKPTIKILEEKTGMTDTIIRNYGKDFYIKHKENKEQLVIRSRLKYPDYTQQKIADLLTHIAGSPPPKC